MNDLYCIDDRLAKACPCDEADIQLSIRDSHIEDFVVCCEASDFCCNVERWQYRVPFNDYIEEVSAGKRSRDLRKAQIYFIHAIWQAIKAIFHHPVSQVVVKLII